MTFDQWQETPNAQELARFMNGKVTGLDAAYISMLVRSAYDAGVQECVTSIGHLNGLPMTLTGSDGIVYMVTGVRT